MGVVRLARRNPSAVLFFVQLLGVVLYPAMEGSRAGNLVFELVGIAVLVLAVYTVRATPALTWVSVVLGVPAVVLSVINTLHGSSLLSATSNGFSCAFYLYAAYSMLRYLLADHDVTVDELFATGAVFTVLAWAFAYLFLFVQALEPGAFGAPTRTWMDVLFLSFTTLSSTGLSDIVPVTGYGRSVLMLEQVVGLGLVAIVVSRVVGLTIRGRMRGER